jgi:hypothetical protein
MLWDAQAHSGGARRWSIAIGIEDAIDVDIDIDIGTNVSRC